jgi:hypothetical protein
VNFSAEKDYSLCFGCHIDLCVKMERKQVGRELPDFWDFESSMLKYIMEKERYLTTKLLRKHSVLDG